MSEGGSIIGCHERIKNKNSFSVLDSLIKIQLNLESLDFFPRDLI